MGTKMKKSLFNGLRYFSNMFDPKEHELQIGYPTDVKHVAHIGWDGPSLNNPSWMNEFRSAPLTATVTDDNAEIPKFPSSEFIAREKNLNASPTEEYLQCNSSRAKHSRRRRSSAEGSGGESTEGSRSSRKETAERKGEESVSGEHEPPPIPKQPRRRRTKGSSSTGGSGESTRPRSRAQGNREVREELLNSDKREEETVSV